MLIKQLLKKYWNYSSFRPLQEEIIHSVLEQKDTLALLPTGGGKSLCYQIPALIGKGKCLVISPLIALMKDQVDNLRSKGILAAAIYSGMSHRMIIQTLKNVAHGPYKILYISPERLSSSLFKEYLPALDINLIAVDEAHCISQWGYDFRPSYLKISELRQDIPQATILALTASATPEVQVDICEKLGLVNSKVFSMSFSRANICYATIKVESKYTKLIQILNKFEGSAIIYSRNRRHCQELTKLLQLQGMSANYYHAGLSSEERTERQNDWILNRTRIIVCTNAFGMGIDKPDVRLVIHVDLPDSLENYYQEAGRAGRDGLNSYAVLLYNEKDLNELRLLEKTRYPIQDEIKTVYKALVNYLQIPSNYGENQSYSFKLETFIKNFNLNSQSTLYALKALEQDGWINMLENSFTPSSLVFTTSREDLDQFLADHPEYELILTTLLRTYGGIFNYTSKISEAQLASLLRLNISVIQKLLKELAGLRVIDYSTSSEEPQIIFLRNRVAVEDFSFDYARFEHRKKAFSKRIDCFINYINTTSCRNGFINKYFGQESIDCGNCDNCRKKNKKTLDKVNFDSLLNKVVEQLTSESCNVNVLSEKLDVKKDELWPILHFLQSEHKIRIQESGELIYQ